MDFLQNSNNFSSVQPTIISPDIPLNTSAQCSYFAWNEENAEKYVCNLCKKSFYNANALQNHKNVQHDFSEDSDCEPEITFAPSNSEYFISICGFKFIPRKDSNDSKDIILEDGLTRRHFKEDTTYLIVKVEDDDLDSEIIKRRKFDLLKRTHMKPYKPPINLRGPFTCTYPPTLRPDLQCRQIFFDCCEYSLHYRQEHTKRRKAALRCQVCEKPLEKDIRASGPVAAQFRPQNRPNYSCRYCRQTFHDSFEHDEHNRIMHAKLKPHQCSICLKRFTQQGGLQQHMRMHSGIRPFGCTFCSKAFTQKAGLVQHLRTHTKVKPFKCVICSKCFSQSVHLRQHMRTHTNIQPFECSACGRRFKQSSHLNFHMRSHIADDGTPLVLERYAQLMSISNPNQLEYNLSNLKPVQDGDTLYYAAELAPEPMAQQAFGYRSQDGVAQ